MYTQKAYTSGQKRAWMQDFGLAIAWKAKETISSL